MTEDKIFRLPIAPLLTICVFVLLLMPIVVLARPQGGITGGGGHLVPSLPTPILLDLFEMGANVPESYNFIRHDEFKQTSLITPIAIDKLSIATLIEARLKVWEPSSPLLIKALRHSLKNMKWYMTPFLFGVGDDSSFQIPNSLANRIQGKDLIKVAYYDSVFGVWLSGPVWHSGLGDFTKAGIVIHETLRQIQIRYKGRIIESSLQKLTSYLLLTAPGQWLPDIRKSLNTLDEPEFLGDQISTTRKSLGHNNSLIQNFKATACTTAAAMNRVINPKTEKIVNNIYQLQNICSQEKDPSTEIILTEWLHISIATLKYLDYEPKLKEQRFKFNRAQDSLILNSLAIGLSDQTEVFQDLEADFKRMGNFSNSNLMKQIQDLKNRGIIK